MASNWIRCNAALLICLGLFSVSHGQTTPRDEILDLVPDDISLCLVINDLREHNNRIFGSPWMKKWQASPLFKILSQSPELRKLKKLDDTLRGMAETNLAQIRDEILGDAVLFGFDHGSKENKERGFLLLHAKNVDLLKRLITLVHEEHQKQPNAPPIREVDYRGTKYFIRKDKQQQQFYFQDGSLFVFTTHQQLLKEIIDRRNDPQPKKSRIVQSFQRLGAENAVATFWLNPRAFDEQWQEKLESGKNSKAELTFYQYWRSLDALACYLKTAPDLELSVAVQGRIDKRHPQAIQFAKTISQPSELWKHFPKKSIKTIATRIDFSALWDGMAGFLDESELADLRRNLQKHIGARLGIKLEEDLIPFLGPDIGLNFAANPGSTELPHGMFAVRLRPAKNETQLPKQILTTIQAYVQLAVAEFNVTRDDANDYLQIKNVDVKGETFKVLDSRHFPAGFQPTLAHKGEYLILATNPQAVLTFAKEKAPVPQNTLLRVSFSELAAALDAQKANLSDMLAGKEKLRQLLISQSISETVRVLELMDSLQLTQQHSAGQVAWSLRLKMKQ